MTTQVATFFPQRVNNSVRRMRGVGAVLGLGTDILAVNLGAPNALDADALLNDQSIASAGSTTTFDAAYTASEAQMGKFGRNVTCVASGAATSTVIVRGRDYLGQRMSETLTLNGTTTVQGVKAFRYIDSIEWGATASTTIDVGIGNVLGLPFKFKQLIAEMKNDVVSANAGTFVAGLANATTPTATNADVRGTYLPVTVIPNGTVVFELRYVVDTNNAHGNAQFFA